MKNVHYIFSFIGAILTIACVGMISWSAYEGGERESFRVALFSGVALINLLASVMNFISAKGCKSSEKECLRCRT